MIDHTNNKLVTIVIKKVPIAGEVDELGMLPPTLY